MGFLNDFVNGKEKKVKADVLAGDINAAGKAGLGMMSAGGEGINKLYSNPENFVGNQIDLENNAIRTAANDAGQRTRQLIAQRGMGTSSIGLGAEVNQAKQLNEKLALNNASGMNRLKGVYDDQMQTGANLFNVKASQGPIQMQDQKYRSGGYGQLLAAGIQAGGMAYGKG